MSFHITSLSEQTQYDEYVEFSKDLEAELEAALSEVSIYIECIMTIEL
jgi:uncharacterized LabA/DUF88 family protein